MKYIKKHKIIGINNDEKKYIIEGIDKVLSKEYADKIIEMIVRRAEYYDKLYC